MSSSPSRHFSSQLPRWLTRVSGPSVTHHRSAGVPLFHQPTALLLGRPIPATGRGGDWESKSIACGGTCAGILRHASDQFGPHFDTVGPTFSTCFTHLCAAKSVIGLKMTQQRYLDPA